MIDDQLAARSESTSPSAQQASIGQVVEVAEGGEPVDDRIEARFGLEGTHVRLEVLHAPRLASGDFEEARIAVHANDLVPGAREPAGDTPMAARDVEDARPWLERQQADEQLRLAVAALVRQ